MSSTSSKSSGSSNLRLGTRWLVGAAVLLTSLLASPQVVSADGVSDAQRKVDRTLQELDDLRDAMGQLDEDYAGAQDRQEELEQDIAESQVRIDDLNGQLGGVQNVLTDIAVDRFTSGGSLLSSPIFSTASAYSLTEQTSALGLAAIDSGEANLDTMQALFDELSDIQTRQQRKKDELSTLIETLQGKLEQYNKLEEDYTAKYAQAKRDLGAAKLQAAEEARAAAAAARARQRSASSSGSAPRTSGGGSSGGGGSSYSAPPVSSRAGIAVRAALGQIGVPYRFAAATPGVAFDCSGLTMWAWNQAGVRLPHQSSRQYSSIAHVALEDAQPGDLIFYYTPISHVGMYIGGGQMVHASHPGTDVVVATVKWNKVIGVGRPG